MKYTLFITVNRANGTDYDMAQREAASFAELLELIEATMADAEAIDIESSESPPSSIILTVVPS